MYPEAKRSFSHKFNNRMKSYRKIVRKTRRDRERNARTKYELGQLQIYKRKIKNKNVKMVWMCGTEGRG